jgi:DNA-binding NarL/FixJ family response regulator
LNHGSTEKGMQEFSGFSDSERRFLSVLKAHFPKLTFMELKVCAYLLKGLTTKEIAQAMQRSPRSIDALRYRLRFKLRLNPQELLPHFLLEFERKHVQTPESRPKHEGNSQAVRQ